MLSNQESPEQGLDFLTLNSDGGFILIDKPLTWTSFDVVRKLKSVIKSKIGHCGTLDPLATGLLIIACGKFTKKIDSIQIQDKTYSGEFYIGATRPSFDRETDIDFEFPTNHISALELKAATIPFIGNIKQRPPVYSAIKKDGQRMYNIARDETKVNPEMAERQQIVYSFEVETNHTLPIIPFKISCNKGTYIRSIANDYGRELNCGAYLHSLRREKIGDFDVKDALDPLEVVRILSQQREDIQDANHIL